MPTQVLICSTALVLLTIILAFLTTLERTRSGIIAYKAELSPSSYLAKIQRAHGNSAEYVGLLIGLFLIVGFTFRGNNFTPLIGWTLIIVTFSRFIHALGFLMSATLENIQILKATGITVIYFGAGFLALKCLMSLLQVGAA